MNPKIKYKDLSRWLKVLVIFVSFEVILTFITSLFIVLIGFGVFN